MRTNDPTWALRRALVLVGLAQALARPAVATVPLVTDDTATQGPGGNQIETQLDVSWTRHPVRVIEPQATFTRGLTESIEALVAIDWVSYRLPDGATTSGWSNAAVGGKWRVYGSEDEGTSFGVKPQVFVPVSEARELRGLGTARTSWSVVGIASHALEHGSVHANVEWARANYADARLRSALRRDRWRLSGSPQWELDESLTLALDAGIVSRVLRDLSGIGGYALAAAIWAPLKDSELALGIGRNFRTGEASATTISAGYTQRFR